ncbi:MAG: thioredoxin domain-containing protein [Candidatus Saccharibacteria bacterium]|nr:thioredoxin domain-containing protein [Candidatus Saccharibacteria bacterium]
MNTRTWIIFAAATIAILAGLVFFSKQNTLNVKGVERFTPFTTQEAVDKVKSGLPDKIFGADNAKVVLIEYGDYSCPGCATLDSSMKRALESYKDKVTFVFRHFPITSIHPNSKIAAAYAEAAGLQGKFWEMHKELFTTQRTWVSVSADRRTELFDSFAKKLGLDMDKLKKDIESPQVSRKIAFDQAIGKESGVTGTPAVFLNGKQLTSNKIDTEEAIKNTLKDALAQ